MNARISSICLMKKDDSFYWKITLVDYDGNVVGTFGDSEHCNDINFRNQTFCLMKILNNWDLLKLDGQKKSFPVLVDNEFCRIEILANSAGEYLEFDFTTGETLSGSGLDVSNFFNREVISLVSRSGVFMSSVVDKYSHRAVQGDMSYVGFTLLYPNQREKELEIKGARCFKEFVCGILGLCNVRELIQSENYPEVLVKFDSNGNIMAIGDIEGREYLYIKDDGYQLFDEDKREIKYR